MTADGPLPAPTAGARRGPASEKSEPGRRALAPPGDDERRPGKGGETSSRLAGQGQCDTNRGRSASRTDDVNVYAVAYFIVGTRGRCRLVLIVARCCFCGRAHAHNAPTDFLAGRRKASCHLGRYVVHVGAVEGAVAA